MGGKHVINTLMEADVKWREKKYEDMIKTLENRYLKKNQSLLYLKFSNTVMTENELISEFIRRSKAIAVAAGKKEERNIIRKLISDPIIQKSYLSFHSKIIRSDKSLAELIEWIETKEQQDEMI